MTEILYESKKKIKIIRKESQYGHHYYEGIKDGELRIIYGLSCVADELLEDYLILKAQNERMREALKEIADYGMPEGQPETLTLLDIAKLALEGE